MIVDLNNLSLEEVKHFNDIGIELKKVSMNCLIVFIMNQSQYLAGEVVLLRLISVEYSVCSNSII